MTKIIPQLAASLPCTKLKEMPTAEMVEIDLKQLDWTYGFLASPKIDGIRSIKHPHPEGMLSRTLKKIPNRHIQQCMNHSAFDLFDGELILGSIQDGFDFNSTQSAVMSEHGNPFFTFCVFDDLTNPDIQFILRNNRARDRIGVLNTESLVDFDVVYVNQKHVKTIDDLLEFEAEQVALGFEGVIFRSLATQYIVNKSKDNRSTFKQQSMIKLKRFNDAEAVITGYEELQTNTNEPTQNAFGRQIRSSHLAGMVGAGTLGKVLAKGINGEWKDVDFAVGSGFDDDTRKLIWRNKEMFFGRTFKYKYQPSGSKDAPRSPIWLGLREGGF